jgi:anti-sigma-K factor RskA
MIKKALAVSFAASVLFAGQFTTLKDGRTIVMHDNGTWEEVTVVQSNNAQAGIMAVKDLSGAAKSFEINEPLARMLVGKWSSRDGAVAYDFRNDGYVTYTLDGGTKTEGYTIQSLDTSDNTVSVSLGESSRYGKVIFGGNLRKFKIAKDGKNMVDYSDEISKLTTVDLRKIGEAIHSPTAPTTPTVKAVTLPAKTDSSKGFVK